MDKKIVSQKTQKLDRPSEYQPAGNEGSVVGVPESGPVRNVEEDDEEGQGLREEAQEDDGIPAESVGPLAEDAKHRAAHDLSHADEDARKADELLTVLQLEREADAGAVHSAEE